MLQIQVLFDTFSNIFEMFGFWSKKSSSKTLNWLEMGCFIFFITVPLVLMMLYLPKARNLEELVASTFFLMGYSYTVGSVGVVWYHRSTLENLMSKISEYFKDEMTSPFIESIVHKTRIMSIVMLTWTTFVLNFGIILVPTFSNSLPIPMWTPNFLDEDYAFGIFWIFQIFSVNYTVGNVAIFVYMCTLLILITGYAELIRIKLKSLVLNLDNTGYIDLVECIQAHRKLKE